MKKILVLPTWILYKMIKPFLPKSHIWKNKKITLKNWSDNSTELNDGFSIFFWTMLFYFIILTLIFLIKF